MLQVTNLTREFDTADAKVAAVNDVSFSVAQGSFAAIIGQSGSGKSTLLSLLGGLDKPTSGSIAVNGKDITKMHDHALIAYRCRQIGFVFQQYNLIPNLTAIENVCLPMEFGKTRKADQVSRAKQLLTQVGLSESQMKRKPGRLSGGQQQRVAIARALANKPAVILADEPTGNLDSKTGEMIFDLLYSLSRSENTTVVIVTHDLSIARKADAALQLKDGRLIGG